MGKQDDLTKEIDLLEKEIFNHVENKEISSAEKIYDKAKELLISVIDESIRNKWKDF